MSTPAGYVNAREACRLLGVSRATLTALVADRRIAHSRVTDGKRAPLAFRKDDIDAYLAARHVHAQQRDADRALATIPVRLQQRRRKVLDLPEAKRYA